MEWMLGLALLLLIAAAGYSSYRRDLRVARARVSSESQVVVTTSGPVEYAIAGEGTPVLVLHGAGGGWDQGLACGRGLIGRGFKVIAPSRFGYLGTPLPADASAQAEADRWADFLTALQIERVPVIAFSAGAAAAVQLALRHPSRVSHLLLAVPGGGGLYSERSAPLPPIALVAIDMLFRFDLAMWLMLRLAPSLMFRLFGVPPSLVAALTPQEKAALDDIVQSILPSSARRAGVLNEAKNQQTSETYDMERIAVPTLLISTADDLYRTLPVARHVAETIAGARLIEFATGGHLLLGHEHELWPAIAAFLRGETKSAAA
jgi:pimeloyl-ACP methyl ester carboxylesterase